MVSKNSPRVKKFLAITILRKGRLSKTHLSNPSVGLPTELKKQQEEAIPVVLTPVSTTLISTMVDHEHKLTKSRDELQTECGDEPSSDG